MQDRTFVSATLFQLRETLTRLGMEYNLFPFNTFHTKVYLYSWIIILLLLLPFIIYYPFTKMSWLRVSTYYQRYVWPRPYFPLVLYWCLHVVPPSFNERVVILEHHRAMSAKIGSGEWVHRFQVSLSYLLACCSNNYHLEKLWP